MLPRLGGRCVGSLVNAMDRGGWPGIPRLGPERLGGGGVAATPIPNGENGRDQRRGEAAERGSSGVAALEGEGVGVGDRKGFSASSASGAGGSGGGGAPEQHLTAQSRTSDGSSA